MDTEADTLSGVEPISYPVDSMEPMSLEDAARDLGAAREKALNPAAERADKATADNELSDEGNAAADEDQPTGETEEADPAEQPPLELPRSWTKDSAERWSKLDPDTQAFLLEQDRKASAEVRRVQNEAAEKLKGLTAKEQQAEQAKLQYEDHAKAALKVLEREQLRDFPDIKTIDDVRNLSVTDPLRYLQWDAHQKEMVAAHAVAQQAEQRQASEQQTNWNSHVQKENALAAEVIPDLADKEKGPALQKRAAGRLEELGFSKGELNDLASGKLKLSIYDHRLQQLIFSDLKLSDIQSAKTAVAAKLIPNVQRPGIARAQGQSNSETIKTLEKQLANATGDRAVEISTQIYQLERKAASR